MKIVLDTNVLLSGLAFSNGPPGRIVSAWETGLLRLLMSEFQLQEITRVLAYPKIRKLLRWDEARRETFVRQLGLRVELIDLTGVTPITVPADPDDNPILTTLVVGRADWLVTGDRGLLALRDRFPVETPVEFVLRLESVPSDRTTQER